METPPESWHQGFCYEVFIHLPLLEDYSAVADNLQEAIDNPDSVVPVRRTYNWRYGVVDGAPPGTKARFSGRLPRPPREPEPQRRDAHDVRRRDAHDARDVYRNRDAQPGRDERAGRDGRGARDGRQKERSARSTCAAQAFTWPARREDGGDDDDDYDHPGGGWDTPAGSGFFSLTDGEPVRRERTRTPPRYRDGSYWRRRPMNCNDPAQERCHRQDEDGDGRAAPGLRREHAQAGTTTAELLPQPSLPDDAELISKTTVELQDIFSKQATKLRSGLQAMAESEVTRANKNDVLSGAQEYIDKACRFAKRLGIAEEPHGNAAWSAATGSSSTVPVTRVFSRLKASLQAPTISDVDAALAALQVPTTGDTRPAPCDGATTVENEDDNCNMLRSDYTNTRCNLVIEPADSPDDCAPAATPLAVDHATAVVGPTLLLSAQNDADQGDGSCDVGGLPLLSAQEESASTMQQEQTMLLAHIEAGLEDGFDDLQVTPRESALAGGLASRENFTAREEPHGSDAGNPRPNAGVESLFCSATAPIVADLPARPARQRRVFNMESTRRSARLATKPALPAMEKAQRNLCRKLGLHNDEVMSLEQVLQKLVSMFVGPLPDHIIAAMSTIFELEDDGQEVLNEILLQHAGDGVGDLEDGV